MNLDSVGVVIVDLHKKKAPLRMVNLADDDSDQDVAIPPKVSIEPSKALKVHAPRVVTPIPNVKSKGGSKEAFPEKAPRGEVGFSFGEKMSEAVRVEEKRDEAKGEGSSLQEEHGLSDNSELGKYFPACFLPFQGSNIDPYLRCVIGLDVVKIMTELCGLIEKGPFAAVASAQAETLVGEDAQADPSAFDVEGLKSTFPSFFLLKKMGLFCRL